MCDIGNLIEVSKGGLGYASPRKFLKIRYPNMLFFWHIFTISMKDILYITLKVQDVVSIQNDLT